MKKIMFGTLSLLFLIGSCAKEQLGEEKLHSVIPEDFQVINAFLEDKETSINEEHTGDEWTCCSIHQPDNWQICNSLEISEIYFNGHNYVFCRRKTQDKIYISSSTDGQKWTGIFTIDNAETEPAAVVFNRQMYVFYVSDTHIVYYRSSDGKTFVGPTAIASRGSSLMLPAAITKAVAPVVVNGRLYIIFADNSGSDLIAIQSPTGLPDSWTIPPAGFNVGEATSEGLSAAARGNQLVLIFVGFSTKRIYEKKATVSTNGGLSWGGKTHILSAATDEKPTISTDASESMVFSYKEKESNKIKTIRNLGNGWINDDFVVAGQGKPNQ